MTYLLSPSPAISCGENCFATWENGFSDEDIERIKEIGDSLAIFESVVDKEQVTTSVRKSKNSWISLNSDTEFLYDKLAWITRQLNGQFFDFDLTGFHESLQYTIYDSSESHYDWHLDRGGSANMGFPPRKLSLVLQLSDPSEYSGGDLELFTAQEPTKVHKQKGLVAAFPSYILHRVTPVTDGIRKSLVLWVGGPKFR